MDIEHEHIEGSSEKGNENNDNVVLVVIIGFCVVRVWPLDME